MGKTPNILKNSSILEYLKVADYLIFCIGENYITKGSRFCALAVGRYGAIYLMGGS